MTVPEAVTVGELGGGLRMEVDGSNCIVLVYSSTVSGQEWGRYTLTNPEGLRDLLDVAVAVAE